jgi:hypothetical protein
LSMDIDSDMTVHIHQPGATPLIFVPDVDLTAIPEASIIDIF